MPIVSVFCKKGGVGKTTFIGYLGHYYAKQGKKVLIISADDQNSIFKIFGEDEKIYECDDNYLEFYIAGRAELGDLLIPVREDLYLIKTLNTDKLSMKLTYERAQEKIIRNMLKEYATFFDYILVDFPPSSSRLTEILLEASDSVCIVVGLDTLGLGGFWNTIQYFIDIFFFSLRQNVKNVNGNYYSYDCCQCDLGSCPYFSATAFRHYSTCEIIDRV